MTRTCRGIARKAKSSRGWMISAMSIPCQSFPLLDWMICSVGTSKAASGVLSSRGVCSTACSPLSQGKDDGVMLARYPQHEQAPALSPQLALAHLPLHLYCHSQPAYYLPQVLYRLGPVQH